MGLRYVKNDIMGSIENFEPRWNAYCKDRVSQDVTALLECKIDDMTAEQRKRIVDDSAKKIILEFCAASAFGFSRDDIEAAIDEALGWMEDEIAAFDEFDEDEVVHGPI